MTKKIGILIGICAFIMVFVSCDMIQSLGIFHPPSDEEIENVTQEISGFFSFLGTAINETLQPEELVTQFRDTLDAFDEEYGSDIKEAFIEFTATYEQNFPTNLPDHETPVPFDTDGAIYLSGGVSKEANIIINFLNPNSSEGGYAHGAVFDLDKYENDESLCFPTADEYGAGYDTPGDWKDEVNVAILIPKEQVLDQTAVNTAQTALEVYCDAAEGTDAREQQHYGFFKSTADIFEFVEKDMTTDDSYWYCTKVVWNIYNKIGIEMGIDMDIDSNSDTIDWTQSGLYSIIKAYYYSRYWDTTVANQKIDEYMQKAKTSLVLAEEIYKSPLLEKIYESIRVSY